MPRLADGSFYQYQGAALKGCPVTPRRGATGGADFNGDGRGDIFWYGPGADPDVLWSGQATRGSFASTGQTVGGSSYVPIAGDFNGDRFSDIFWYGPGAVSDVIWYGTATPGAWSTTGVNVGGTYIPIP